MVYETTSVLERTESNYEDYPRPQMKREYWYDLNGEWQFEFDDEDRGEGEKFYLQERDLTDSIQVPYAYQSAKSGVQVDEIHEVVWYKREFHWDIDGSKKVLLHFEAVDYYTKVWVNGEYIGDHEGGHTPFSFSITNALSEGHNTVVIRVEDRNSVEQPIGKQSWKGENFLCWYSRTTGIWQPVWLEEVPTYHIEDVKMTPSVEDGKLSIEATLPRQKQKAYLEACVYFKGEWIDTVGVWVKEYQTSVELTASVDSDQANFRVYYWTPDTPNLYDVTFSLSVKNEVIDKVDSYFGMRSIEVQDGRVLLNKETFYQKLILDQGYYPDSLMTADFEQMKTDLLKVKEMGFNGVRRHQTIADRRYMTLCDQLGLVMWAEMPSSFKFTCKSMARMMDETREMVTKHYNHPSVIIYTLMNESWGVNEIYHREDQQAFVNAIYYQTKAQDPNRLIVGNDGWEHTVTDLLTIHDYNSDADSMRTSYENKSDYVNGSPSKTSRKQNYAKGYEYKGEPIIISEYGGIAYGSESREEEWGYGFRPHTQEEVIDRLTALTKVIMENDAIQGFCYTQLTDVEQEVNGLLDDRHENKFNTEEIRKILLSKQSNGFIFE
ncbi:glycoside hydrolase family 2 [Bacillus sp. NTK071]|uniref:sugar-binding domain-containing protein n=1 Tax=Bacillus sp. NTK071 TaxID=2802175 RepID=UPI001A8FDBE2|nr:sugar-binding domain-containing protein [Bacillus sp. NTK071]MBN8210180.1 glycoside hydrolase family 2 [Bacillus sp. NTK071]